MVITTLISIRKCDYYNRLYRAVPALEWIDKLAFKLKQNKKTAAKIRSNTDSEAKR